MHAIAVPSDDDEQVFDRIAASKLPPRDALLVACRSAVLGGYAAYVAQAPHVAMLPGVSLSTEQGKALVHAYEVQTEPMKALRERLFAPVSNVRCPYCGITETSTLDHYLPKEKHPQYAVFSKNLVPCCSPCNELKRDLVLNAGTNVRIFLHPYFDVIPRSALLSVAVSLVDDLMVLRFSVGGPPGVPAAVLAQIQAHFRKLKLAQRYVRNALEYLRGQRHDYRRFYSAGGNDRVCDELGHEASKFERDFGPNHWRAALCRELAGNTQFCAGGFSVLERMP